MAHRQAKIPAQFSSAEGLLLIAGFCTVSVLFVALVVILNALKNQIIALPTLSIAGIVLLLISLAAISYVFVRTGLQDPKQALGLPAGSIQAVIALSLVVLFAILSIFIFASMGETSLRKLSGLDEAGRKEQVDKLGASFAGWEQAPDKSFTIYVREPGIDARNDVGKQLIVLIGTLMTSAVSFYFGTRAMAAGVDKGQQGGDGGADPGGDGPASWVVAPDTLALGEAPQTLTITGDGVGKATAVSFRQAGAADGARFEGTVTDRSDRALTCTVSTAGSPPGAYDVVLDIDGAALVRARGLTLRAAQPGPTGPGVLGQTGRDTA